MGCNKKHGLSAMQHYENYHGLCGANKHSFDGGPGENEGLEMTKGKVKSHGMMDMEDMMEPLEPEDDAEESDDSKGMSCPHGCGLTMKSAHGLARHIHAKHGGFKGIGRALMPPKNK